LLIAFIFELGLGIECVGRACRDGLHWLLSHVQPRLRA
jgi:hypothetical protein